LTWPKVTIIWLNYNSSKIMNIILRSLESIANLDYPNYELIVVDNGSIDKSFEKIKEFLDKKNNLRKKIIKLNKNLGFTGGNNIGFRARDLDSKYIVLLNNDAIIFDHSLKELVEYAELRNDIGAIQGIIVDLDNGRVDTTGSILTEFLIGAQIYHGRNPMSIKKAFYITYADGAFSLYRIDSIKKATGFSDRIFYDEMFAYFDDNILGLQLWNSNFKIISIPKVLALHRRSSSFGKISPLKLYLIIKGFYALNEITNARFKSFIHNVNIIYNMIGGIFVPFALKIIKNYENKEYSLKDFIKAIYLACIHGTKWGRNKLREMNKPIDIYKAPLIRSSPKILIPWFLGLGSAFGKRIFTEIITEEFEKNINNYIVDWI